MTQPISVAAREDDPDLRAHQLDREGPQASGPSPAWRRLAPVAVGSVTVAATMAVGFWNPGDAGVPLCPSKFMFGVDCPFCGASRATAALARGEFGRALDHNLLFVGLVPLVIAAFVVWTVRAFQGRPMPRVSLPRWFWVAAGVAFVAFGIARNLDVSEFTRWLGADAVGA